MAAIGERFHKVISTGKILSPKACFLLLLFTSSFLSLMDIGSADTPVAQSAQATPALIGWG
jgi:hypothetical protein